MRPPRDRFASRLVAASALLLAAALAETPALAQEAEGAPTAAADSVLLRRADAARVFGPPDARVVIVEVTDFSCPSCRASHEQKGDSLRVEFAEQGGVRLVHLAMPLAGLPRSWHGAEAALCAGGVAGQEGFLRMKDVLYRRQNEWRHLADPRPLLREMAADAGVPAEAFEDCQRRSAVAPLILGDLRHATTLRLQGVEIRGTPTYVFNQAESFAGVRPIQDFRDAVARATAALDAAEAEEAAPAEGERR